MDVLKGKEEVYSRIFCFWKISQSQSFPDEGKEFQFMNTVDMSLDRSPLELLYKIEAIFFWDVTPCSLISMY
jgi:hypothetical protein